MKRKLVCLLIALLVGPVLLTACSSDKRPADEALRTAEEAINATKTEAVKYMPDQVKAMEDAVASLKSKFGKGEYKTVITEAQSLAAEAKEMLETAKVKKDELASAWTSLSVEVPKMIAVAQGQVDTMSKLKTLPGDLTSEQFTEATSELSAAQEEWTKALAAFNAENLAEAVSMANSVKQKAERTTEILGSSSTKAAPEETPAALAPEKPSVAKKAPTAKKSGREKALAAKKAPARDKPAAHSEKAILGYMGKVTQVNARTIVVKGEKGPVAFNVRKPKLQGYKDMGGVMTGDTVAAMYTDNGKGITITKIKGKDAPTKPGEPKKTPKAKKAAPVPAR